MITKITPLPTPPQPSDTPTQFDQKAFALLGGLPGFVTEANQLGEEVSIFGGGVYSAAAQAEQSVQSASTSETAAAQSASSAADSAHQAAVSFALTNQAKIDAQAASQRAQEVSVGMESAIALANTFYYVPAVNQGPMVVITHPHLRFMVWNGVKYVRAPWHRPCDLFFSYDNPANIPGALQVRADATYQQANYPDVVERLGLSGAGTFTLVEARGEFLRVLDNGRGIDTARALRSWQDGQVQVHHHTLATSISGSSGQVKSASGGSLHNDANFLQFMGTDVAQSYPLYAASMGGSESRVRNIAFPLWMTY